MKIENKEMLLYSMDKAYEELYEKASDLTTEIQEIYYRIGNSLQWIMSCFDRIKDEMPEKEKILFLALAAANNAQKHIREFERMDIKTGGGYEKKYPRSYEVRYIWRTLESVPIRSKNEKRYYQEYLTGKNILNELSKAKLLIHEYFERCD